MRLLPGATKCAVVTTSQARLAGLAGATNVHLDVLGDEVALRLLAIFVGAERLAPNRKPPPSWWPRATAPARPDHRRRQTLFSAALENWPTWSTGSLTRPSASTSRPPHPAAALGDDHDLPSA